MQHTQVALGVLEQAVAHHRSSSSQNIFRTLALHNHSSLSLHLSFYFCSHDQLQTLSMYLIIKCPMGRIRFCHHTWMSLAACRLATLSQVPFPTCYGTWPIMVKKHCTVTFIWGCAWNSLFQKECISMTGSQAVKFSNMLFSALSKVLSATTKSYFHISQGTSWVDSNNCTQ